MTSSYFESKAIVMLQWLRSLFTTSPALSANEEHPSVESANSNDEESENWPRLQDVHVVPDSHADFDRAACEGLIAKLRELGAGTVLDASGIAVSLEEFFTGNRCRHSIAANVQLPPPYDTAEAWYQLLKQVRATNCVSQVWVQITDLEAYEDGRVGTWPYSDTIWIYSSLDRDQIAELVAPLEPDYVQDASLHDPNFDLQPPFPPEPGTRPYWIWWD